MYLFQGTGEHGVGIGKRGYLNDELGEGTVALMKTIKKALDPYNLFNPGKVRYTDGVSTPSFTFRFPVVSSLNVPRRLL